MLRLEQPRSRTSYPYILQVSRNALPLIVAFQTLHMNWDKQINLHIYKDLQASYRPHLYAQLYFQFPMSENSPVLSPKILRPPYIRVDNP